MMSTKKSRFKDLKKGSRRHKSGKPRKAESADRHALYEQSVQATDFEYEFVDDNFRRIRGRSAQLLREDFCGTAQMCCEWVRGREDNRAVGVDLDAEVLEWGSQHHIAALDDEQKTRVTLLQDDVLTAQTEPADIVMAMNFSWQFFKTRDALRGYFETARNGLVDDGILFLDAFGGYDAYREIKEKTKHKGFNYVWEQASYDPVSGDMRCHIHFTFNDGSKLKNAFTYEWRLWSLPEVRELLVEAGFANVTIYWQGTDEDGEPNGEFEPATRGDADPAWICMISAEK
jgi:hypothetical protein